MKEIPLSQGKTTLVDDKDFVWLNQWKWYTVMCRGVAYVQATVNGKKVWLHRLITNCPGWMETDHMNMNPLDNRRANLRLCTRNQNLGNRKIPKNNTSGYKGVWWEKRRKRWRATIWIDSHSLYLGSYLDIEEAAKAYDDAARKHFGEFARLNFPKKGERGCRQEI